MKISLSFIFMTICYVANLDIPRHFKFKLKISQLTLLNEKKNPQKTFYSVVPVRVARLSIYPVRKLVIRN